MQIRQIRPISVSSVFGDITTSYNNWRDLGFAFANELEEHDPDFNVACRITDVLLEHAVYIYKKIKSFFLSLSNISIIFAKFFQKY